MKVPEYHKKSEKKGEPRKIWKNRNYGKKQATMGRNGKKQEKNPPGIKRNKQKETRRNKNKKKNKKKKEKKKQKRIKKKLIQSYLGHIQSYLEKINPYLGEIQSFLRQIQ